MMIDNNNSNNNNSVSSRSKPFFGPLGAFLFLGQGLGHGPRLENNNNNNLIPVTFTWDATVTALTSGLELNCLELIGDSHIVNVEFEARIQSKQFLLSSPGHARPWIYLLLKLRSCMVGPISNATTKPPWVASAKLNAVSPKTELFIRPTSHVAHCWKSQLPSLMSHHYLLQYRLHCSQVAFPAL